MELPYQKSEREAGEAPSITINTVSETRVLFYGHELKSGDIASYAGLTVVVRNLETKPQ